MYDKLHFQLYIVTMLVYVYTTSSSLVTSEIHLSTFQNLYFILVLSFFYNFFTVSVLGKTTNFVTWVYFFHPTD